MNQRVSEMEKKYLFESTWRDGFNCFERVYDTLLNRSIKRLIDLPAEWYEPHSKGLYESILDANIKLDKKQGRARDGRDQYGFTDPMFRNIRENYWQHSYNQKPRIWYLDIETRSGRSYKNLGIGELVIKNTKTQKEQKLPVREIQELFYNTGEGNFQYLDEGTKQFKPLSSNFYMQRNKGFPQPNLALEEVSMIQIFDSELDQVIMIGLKEWKHREDYEHLMEYPLKYIVADNEIHLFEIYNNLFSKLNPLVIYAWNGDSFDFPYLHNRMKNLGIDQNAMSNYGEVKYSEGEWQGRTEYKIETPGHYYIDMIDSYKHHVKSPRSSYALDNIAEIELKEKKVDHSEYSQFDHFYLGLYNIPENPTPEQENSKIYQLAIKEGVSEEVRELGHSEFCWYSYKDPLLIKKLDDELNFTALMINAAQRMGVRLIDSFGTVRPWSQYIANIALKNNQVLPPREDHPHPKVVGGHVMDPVHGKKKWVISADVNSMYPLLGMVAANMSPETFVDVANMPAELRDIVLAYFNGQDEGPKLDYNEDIWERLTELLKKYNVSLGINGVAFSNDKIGLIPSLVSEIYTNRKKTRVIEGNYRSRKMLIEKILHSKRTI